MGNLSTPKTVQKLQKALHAKAKADAGYRFYALYDKISREDILAHAYAQCRSNKGAPGVDGQDFANIEAYGVQRWLGELAAELGDFTRPMMSGSTGFHTDQTRRKLAKEVQDLLAPQLTGDDNLARTINAVNLEYVLGEINADGVNMHVDDPLR